MMHEDDELSQAVGPDPVHQYNQQLLAQAEIRQEEPILQPNDSKSSSNETGNLVEKVLQSPGSITSSEKNFEMGPFNEKLEMCDDQPVVNLKESPAVNQAPVVTSLLACPRGFEAHEIPSQYEEESYMPVNVDATLPHHDLTYQQMSDDEDKSLEIQAPQPPQVKKTNVRLWSDEEDSPQKQEE